MLLSKVSSGADSLPNKSLPVRADKKAAPSGQELSIAVEEVNVTDERERHSQHDEQHELPEAELPLASEESVKKAEKSVNIVA